MLVKRSLKGPVEPAVPAPDVASDSVHDLRHGATAAIRRQAAHDLRERADCIPLLCGQLGEEADRSVRAAILNALIRLRSPAVSKGLAQHLRSEDAALRNEVIEALQDMPEEAMPVLRDLLDDEDSDIRIFAVNILAGLAHVKASDLLAQVIRQDAHVNVCMAALDGLLETGDASVVDDVERLGQRFDAPYVRFAVTAALQRLRAQA